MIVEILTIIVLVYLVLMAFVLLFANRMIFPAPDVSYVDNDRIFKLPIRDGDEIAAVYLPNADAEYTILYSHGNSEDLGHIMPHLRDLHEAGFSVMAYDYPGYGLSDGRPSEQGALEAAAAAFSYLVILQGVSPDTIILYGRSLGSGPSYELASKKPVAGMIINGGFSSTFRVMTKWQVFPWDIFDNAAKVRDVQCPVLIIHGVRDKTVPFSHAQYMQKRLKVPVSTLYVAQAGHNNLIEVAEDEYWDALRKFSDSLKNE